MLWTPIRYAIMFSEFIRLIHGFVLVIGPKAAGKTSILHRLVTGNFEEHEPTLGYAEEHIAKVRVIEIGGQQSFQKYWQTALEQQPVHTFFVIDITQKEEYDLYKTFSHKQFSNKQNIKTHVTLCANKVDLIQEIPEYLNENEDIIICSAKEGNSMMDILEIIGKYHTKTEHQQASQEKLASESKSEITSKKTDISSLKDKYKDKF